MRVPLFFRLAVSKRCHLVPPELRHSGILSSEYLRGIGRADFVWAWEKPSGLDIIYAIALRCTRGKIMRRQTFESLLLKIARTIYEHATPLAYFTHHHCPSTSRNACGVIGLNGLVLDGRHLDCWEPKYGTITIHPAPSKPCRWCGARVELGRRWPGWRTAHWGKVHCKSPICRHMDWLSDKPQKHGGINLTPRQREETDYEARDTVRAFNYLQLRIKEAKRNGRKPTSDLR